MKILTKDLKRNLKSESRNKNTGAKKVKFLGLEKSRFIKQQK